MLSILAPLPASQQPVCSPVKCALRRCVIVVMQPCRELHPCRDVWPK